MTCGGENCLRFLLGLLLVSTGVLAMALIGGLLQYAVRHVPTVVAIVTQAALLSCMFSVRSLASAATRVARALYTDELSIDDLSTDDLSEARHLVSYHLVSRDVSRLDASGLSAATIESVAENTSDSVVAPVFYFAIAGLPGVLVYRFVNTCDAMLGYRTAELEWYGKAAAKLDDLLNFVPARITALIMLTYSILRIGSRPRCSTAVSVWWRDHRRTASPNAGHPMSAAAGVLGVALEKEGHYLLGGDQPKPSAADIDRAVPLVWATSVIFVLLVSAVLLLGAIK
jgi:adenosylcobinamide-phosphate synthase